MLQLKSKNNQYECLWALQLLSWINTCCWMDEQMIQLLTHIDIISALFEHLPW